MYVHAGVCLYVEQERVLLCVCVWRGGLSLYLSIMAFTLPIGKADGHYTEDSPFKDKTTVFFVVFFFFLFFFTSKRALLMSCFGVYLFCKRDAVREK